MNMLATFTASRPAWANRFRSIVIEGPIGVGKSSLAMKFAERFGYVPLMEAPQENPFLAKFYRDSSRYALPAQLFFLFQRIDQLREVAQRDLFSENIVSDFMIEKDPLFARLTLSDEELSLYQKIYDAQRPQAPTPDLVILLQASADALIERIRQRGFPWNRTCPRITCAGSPKRIFIFFTTMSLHRC